MTKEIFEVQTEKGEEKRKETVGQISRYRLFCGTEYSHVPPQNQQLKRDDCAAADYLRI